MTRRYVTRPHAWVSATSVPEQLPSVTVWEDEGRPVDTGLLDASGTKLWRVEDREPIGFCLSATIDRSVIKAARQTAQEGL